MKGNTRQQILERVALEVLQKGFYSTRADLVIKELKVSKGALYHYFPNKEALGNALIDEIIAPFLRKRWVTPLLEPKGNPCDVIVDIFKEILQNLNEQQVKYGCPFNNLVQEFATVNEGFRIRLEVLLDEICETMANALQKGQEQELIYYVDAHKTAQFLIASVEGAYGMAKLKQSSEFVKHTFENLITYIDSLKRK
ncbi:MAG: TetR/AcrR family transcriptional regulator [Aureispira sp.]|nr:TetR/AcrR family transcriptional regulator [Aureispira sp.]